MFRGPGLGGREAKARRRNTGGCFLLGQYHPPTVSDYRNGPKCPHVVYTNSAVVRGFGAWGMVASEKGSRGSVVVPHPHTHLHAPALLPPAPSTSVSCWQLLSALFINQALIFLFTHLSSCCREGGTDTAPEFYSHPGAPGGGPGSKAERMLTENPPPDPLLPVARE